MRWTTDANWKLGAANFAGDGAHIGTTHGFLKELNLGTARGPHIQSSTMPMRNGHSGVCTYRRDGAGGDHYLGLPKEIWPEIDRHLTAEQLEIMRPLVGIIGNVFPNTSFLTTSKHLPEEWGGAPDENVSFLTLRQWQPKGPQKMEVWSWCFVDKNAAAPWKEASSKCYLRSFGMSGMFEQDDMENWAEITQGLKSPIAQRLWLQYKMGMDVKPSEKWSGPGAAYSHSSPMELNERHFYSHWLKLMMEDA